MTVIVTQHAAQRWCERVQPVTLSEARAAIHEHDSAIECALSFGAPVVRLNNGARLVLNDGAVITVYAKGEKPRQIRQHWREEGL